MVAVLVAFSFQTRNASQIPLTIELEQDVAVTHNTEPAEHRGKLYLADTKASAFRLRKNQRFEMLSSGAEGSCRIKFEDREYDLTSCPWLAGFHDHQSDFFKVLAKR